jgi:hypothetical protein
MVVSVVVKAPGENAEGVECIVGRIFRQRVATGCYRIEMTN